MWDERYSSSEYAYGTEPNDFLKDNCHYLPKGRVLSLAEGEGRNAVYLACQGYAVTAVDSSSVGIEKGKKLAALHNVNVEFILADLAEFDMGVSCWDAIISIFCPVPGSVRQMLHEQVKRGLKAGGVFLVEAYTPAQIHNETGGGKNRDVLQTCDTLATELDGLHFEHLVELERNIIEGRYHTGRGSVVQAIATRSKEAV